MVLLTDVLAIGVVIGLVAMYALPEKYLRIADGAILCLLGILPVLFMFNVINFDINSYLLVRFIALYVVIDVGSTLFAESIKEQEIWFKAPSMIFGLLIVLVTSIPWLEEFGAISFGMPSYSPLIDLILYIIAGALAIIGAFKAGD